MLTVLSLQEFKEMLSNHKGIEIRMLPQNQICTIFTGIKRNLVKSQGHRKKECCLRIKSVPSLNEFKEILSNHKGIEIGMLPQN